jgi:hypothetical protein
MDLASEENQHPVMCNMDEGTDCTLVAPQEYDALSNTTQKLGIKVVGSLHDDVEDPSTNTEPGVATHLQMFERYGMAWIEYWAAGDCAAASYLDGAGALADQTSGLISIFAGGLQPPPACS